MDELKVCSKCGVAKPHSEYYAGKRYADGLRRQCKPCFTQQTGRRRKHQSVHNREYYLAQRNAWNALHREELRQKRRDYLRAHPDRTRAANLKSKYGITVEEWNVLFASQGSRCAICGSEHPKSYGLWHTDHDHVTGKVRGILCQQCNVGLGKLGESQDGVVRAIKYLTESVDTEIDYGQTRGRKAQRTLRPAILGRFGNVCGICGVSTGRRLDIDHNHTTGKVRGVLCYPCNLGIGAFNDSVEVLSSALRYLEARNLEPTQV